MGHEPLNEKNKPGDKLMTSNLPEDNVRDKSRGIEPAILNCIILFCHIHIGKSWPGYQLSIIYVVCGKLKVDRHILYAVFNTG